ncbi:MAG: hypothetical protein WAL67_08535 [Candidatus Cybelea sp.]
MRARSGPALNHKSGVVETVLYSFGSHGLDGAWPRAGLIDVKATLYGTTFTGAHTAGAGFAVGASRLYLE